MPAILKITGSVLMSLLTSLMTEAFLRAAIIMALEKLVKKTKTDADDRLLAKAKKIWEQ